MCVIHFSSFLTNHSAHTVTPFFFCLPWISWWISLDMIVFKSVHCFNREHVSPILICLWWINCFVLKLLENSVFIQHTRLIIASLQLRLLKFENLSLVQVNWWSRINLPCMEPSSTSSTPLLVWKSLVVRDVSSVGAGILLLPRSLGIVGVGLGTILLVCFGRMAINRGSHADHCSYRHAVLLCLERDLQVHKGEDLCWYGIRSLWKRLRYLHWSLPCMFCLDRWNG